ncbi:MAG: AMP-binding protein [Candidatus Heimdallarchaeaceae archaeon]
MSYPLSSADESFTIPKVTLGKMLENSAKKHPNNVAIYDQGKTITYGELLIKSKFFAEFLIHSGIEKDDVVAILLDNRLTFPIVFFGTLFAGTKVTVISPRLTANEFQYVINDVGASVLVTYPKQCERHSKKIISYPFKLKVLDILQGEELSDICKNQDYILLESIIKQKSIEFEDKAQWDQVAVLLYTGGTTGFPKGVMLTHYNLVANAFQFNHALKIRKGMKGEKVLATLPLCHSFGLLCALLSPLFVGAEVVLHNHFDPSRVLADIQKLKITRFYGVPTMYIGLLRANLERYDLSSLKTCVAGGSALPQEVFDEFYSRTGIQIIEGYGLTECSPVTHLNPLDNPIPGSIGKPLIGTKAIIIDFCSDEEVNENEEGELAIKGPQVMKGYWKKAMDTIRIFTKDGWLRTGDVAKRDSAGYYYIVDRIKEVINSGGLKIYPREVEEAIYRHPAVKMAAVIGVPDDYYGEIPKAYIVCKKGMKIREEELKDFLKDLIAKYKIPKKIVFVENLPLSPTGKILKSKILEKEMH